MTNQPSTKRLSNTVGEQWIEVRVHIEFTDKKAGKMRRGDLKVTVATREDGANLSQEIMRYKGKQVTEVPSFASGAYGGKALPTSSLMGTVIGPSRVLEIKQNVRVLSEER